MIKYITPPLTTNGVTSMYQPRATNYELRTYKNLIEMIFKKLMHHDQPII